MRFANIYCDLKLQFSMGNLNSTMTGNMAPTIQSLPDHGMIRIEEMGALNPVLSSLELINIDEKNCFWSIHLHCLLHLFGTFING